MEANFMAALYRYFELHRLFLNFFSSQKIFPQILFVPYFFVNKYKFKKKIRNEFDFVFVFKISFSVGFVVVVEVGIIIFYFN